MKYTLISDIPYPFINGGAQKRNFEILTRLNSRGIKIDWYCMNIWNPKERIFRYKNLKYIGINKINKNHLYNKNRRSFLSSLIFSFKILKEFKNFGEIVEINQFPLLHIPILIILLKVKKKKFFITWHETWTSKYWIDYAGIFGLIGFTIQKFLTKFQLRIVTVSNLEKKKLINFGFKKKNIQIIENGLIFPSKLDIDTKKQFNLIYFGRFLKHKNIILLVNLFSILLRDNRNLKLCLAGEGPQLNEIENQINKLKINDNIQIFYKPKNILKYNLLAESNFFISLSEREGFGITLVEALATGVPGIILRSDNNSMIEIAVKSNSCFILERKEIELMSKDLKNILQNDPKIYFDSASLFASRYEWNNIFKKYLIFLKINF